MLVQHQMSMITVKASMNKNVRRLQGPLRLYQPQKEAKEKIQQLRTLLSHTSSVTEGEKRRKCERCGKYDIGHNAATCEKSQQNIVIVKGPSGRPKGTDSAKNVENENAHNQTEDCTSTDDTSLHF
jgi:hypothetical protein